MNIKYFTLQIRFILRGQSKMFQFSGPKQKNHRKYFPKNALNQKGVNFDQCPIWSRKWGENITENHHPLKVKWINFIGTLHLLHWYAINVRVQTCVLSLAGHLPASPTGNRYSYFSSSCKKAPPIYYIKNWKFFFSFWILCEATWEMLEIQYIHNLIIIC